VSGLTTMCWKSDFRFQSVVFSLLSRSYFLFALECIYFFIVFVFLFGFRVRVSRFWRREGH